MRKIGKTARPFRYDLNQISYNYTVEVMNRFKRLDQIHKMAVELWTELVTLAEGSDQNHSPQEKEIQAGKLVV